MDNFYDTLTKTGARKYESWYEKEGKEIAKREAKALLLLLKNFKGSHVLKIGCGTGYFSRLLKKKGFRVVGLDKAWQMLKLTHLKGIKSVRADARLLPFKNKFFDVSLFVTSFEFMKESNKVLNEAMRVTKKAIIFLLLNPFHFINIKRKLKSFFYSSPFRHMKVVTPSKIKKITKKICKECTSKVCDKLMGKDVFYTAQILIKEDL
jgi:ubiquinone/menaquinone biosynthesis C-methylase UbiE